MRTFGKLALGLALALAVVACGKPVPPPPAPDAPPAATAPAAPAAPAANPATAAYICPMPEDAYGSNAPGKCPKCGMDLVPNKRPCACPADSHCEPCKKGESCACPAPAAAPAAGTQSGAGASTGGSDCGSCEHGPKPAGSACAHGAKPEGAACEHSTTGASSGGSCPMTRS